jgi:hypothetical protein
LGGEFSFLINFLDNKKMKIKNLMGTLAAALLTAGPVQALPASLHGTTISASYNGDPAGMLGLDHGYQPEAGSNVTAIAGGDIEFITADFRFMFDFMENGGLTVYNNSDWPLAPGMYAMRFSFGPGLAAPLTGMSLLDASAISGLPVVTVEDANTFTLDLSALQWNGQFGMFTAQLDSAAVPEPGSMTLLLMGAGAAMLARRKRPARH